MSVSKFFGGGEKEPGGPGARHVDEASGGLTRRLPDSQCWD